VPASSGLRNCPVWLAGQAATSSGVPAATDQAASGATFRAHVDKPVGRLR